MALAGEVRGGGLLVMPQSMMSQGVTRKKY
uniref:Uncharacterized protein n=1 Tax=Anguilla anguilla TaxID=7936 RepID=A0A0E9UGZ5_ANGAN